MSFSKIIVVASIVLFGVIGVAAIVKKAKTAPSEISLAKPQKLTASQKTTASKPVVETPIKAAAAPIAPPVPPAAEVIAVKDDFPIMDRIHQLFTTGPTKLPIVETITYSSTVSWLKGRPAWIADYASHYQTSRHFIARSLNGKSDYFTQKIATGSRFNVFSPEKNIQFYLLVDISRCKMGFYYVDLDTQERVLLKTYKVGIGRPSAELPSGTLTPLGKYSLGKKIAIYKPGIMGYYLDQKEEMIRVFGTRWIPFDQELEGATASSKGYGIHGTPWKEDPKTGVLVENREGLGAYDSDGCIRLSLEDIEELFAIVITKPTFIDIVKDFHEAKLPGVEVASPKREGR